MAGNGVGVNDTLRKLTQAMPTPKKDTPCQELLKEPFTHSGFLRKQKDSATGKFFQKIKGNWSQVFVVLAGGCVYIYSSESAPKYERATTLYGFNEVLQTNKQANWNFKVVNGINVEKSLNFSASSEQDLNTWIKSFSDELVNANLAILKSDLRKGTTYGGGGGGGGGGRGLGRFSDQEKETIRASMMTVDHEFVNSDDESECIYVESDPEEEAEEEEEMGTMDSEYSRVDEFHPPAQITPSYNRGRPLPSVPSGVPSPPTKAVPQPPRNKPTPPIPADSPAVPSLPSGASAPLHARGQVPLPPANTSKDHKKRLPDPPKVEGQPAAPSWVSRQGDRGSPGTVKPAISTSTVGAVKAQLRPPVNESSVSKETPSNAFQSRKVPDPPGYIKPTQMVKPTPPAKPTAGSGKPSTVTNGDSDKRKSNDSDGYDTCPVDVQDQYEAFEETNECLLSSFLKAAYWPDKVEDAQKIMLLISKEGVYMLRDANDGQAYKTLLVTCNDTGSSPKVSLRKFKILKDPAKGVYIVGQKSFESLEQLIRFYCANSLPNRTTKLVQPYSEYPTSNQRR